MILWRTLLLVLPCLAPRTTTSSDVVAAGAVATEVLGTSRLHDDFAIFDLEKGRLCVDPEKLPKDKCTVMKDDKVYAVNKADLKPLTQYGMSFVSIAFPKIAFLGKPHAFCCCCYDVFLVGILNPPGTEKGQLEEKANTIWRRWYKALAQDSYYDKFMNHEDDRVDVASKEAVNALSEAKSTPQGEESDLTKVLQMVDRIRINELEERLSQAEIIEEERLDVW